MSFRKHLFAAIAALSITSIASAQLTAVGAPVPEHGFPSSYTDRQAVTLGPCLVNSGFCLLDAAVALRHPTQPFPANYGGTFPAEFFYWAGQARMATDNGGSALLVMALQGAFANEIPLAAEQVTFGRIRIRADNLQDGAIYRVTTPYGTFDLQAQPDDVGLPGISFTRDIGGLPGDFVGALTAGIGPFLQWDSDLPIVDGLGNEFIGDPSIDHTVIGSPFGTNFFRIEGPNVGGAGVNSIETNLFAVMGMHTAPGGGGGGGAVTPVANFSAAPSSGVAPLNVSFTDLSTNAPTSWAWDFGDGSSSTAPSPSHVYTLPGIYSVGLTATNSAGANTQTVTGMITVTAPTLRIESITPGTAGVRNTFVVSGATPGASVFVLWSRSLGATGITLRSCNVTLGLEAPQQLWSGRARNGTTVTRSVSISRALRGITVHLQAVDTGNCALSPVFSEAF